MTIFLGQATIVVDIFHNLVAPSIILFEFYEPETVSMYLKITLSIRALTFIIINIEDL